MGPTILAGFFLLVAVGMVLGAKFGMPKVRTVRVATGSRYSPSYDTQEKKNFYRFWVMAGAVVPVILAAVTFFAAGFTSVPTKSEGVLTSYGKVFGDVYQPGGHWILPWKTMNVVGDTIQSDNFKSANGNGPDQYTNSGAIGNCIQVRLGGQNEGCADVQLQTQVIPKAIPELFANYSSYGPNLSHDVDQYVVKRDLTTVLNRVVGDYNPIQDVSQQLQACDLHAAANCQVGATSQFSKFDPELVAQLQAALGNQVNVIDVNLQYIHYDPTTENALQKIQTSYLETAQAVQQEKTNAALSLANAALARGGSLSPQVLANECFTTTQQAIKSGYQLPAGWSCNGSSSSSLLINGK